MERRSEEIKGKGKECFSSDRLMNRKRNIDDENLDLELRLGPMINGNSGVEYSKKSKILVNPSNSDDNNNKNENEFQFSLLLPSEIEEEGREKEDFQSPKHLEGKMKNLIESDDKKNEENDGSSVVPVFESQPVIQGPSLRRVGSGESLKLVQKLIVATLVKTSNENSPALSAYIAKAKWLLKYLMIKMPRVFTKSDGRNVNKIDGLLFAYEKKGDVQIVCICHGHILSPVEFVKHAGGGDVENPLRHIIVTTLPM